ncbi:hypothetical protein FT642_26700 [Bacillus paranthracis]|uniref:hypothetical protein n=1 Tax=Bacillus paranthracis TaxID=2026186 RepID=UPI00187A09CD|nr:hypothetical protein [Bacillus paranthracis]MBE7135164.1 hypothetical protein [Bacillus paranthracis]
MKFFKVKYILLSVIFLFILSLIVAALDSNTVQFNIGYLLGSSLMLFLSWSVYLTLFIFVFTLILGLVWKLKNKGSKKIFITSISSLCIAAILFVILGIVAVLAQEPLEQETKQGFKEEKNIIDTTKNISNDEDIPRDARVFIDRYKKFSDINSDLNLLSIQTDNLNVKTANIEGRTSNGIDLIKSDLDNNFSIFTLVLNSDQSKVNTIFFSGDAKSGAGALLGSAGSLGIQDNKELQDFLIKEFVEVVNSQQKNYSKTLNVDGHTIMITYDLDMGLTFFISV